MIPFISNLDILDEEINEIAQRVSTPVRQYEIVWFPIVDKPMTKEEVIEKKAGLMKWYSLHYSVTLEPYVIQYIKRDSLFEKKLVDGSVQCPWKGRQLKCIPHDHDMGKRGLPFPCSRRGNSLEKFKMEP